VKEEEHTSIIAAWIAATRMKADEDLARKWRSERHAYQLRIYRLSKIKHEVETVRTGLNPFTLVHHEPEPEPINKFGSGAALDLGPNFWSGPGKFGFELWF
jgi:hypothetical protein